MEHCYIGYEKEDSSINFVYCHENGEPENMQALFNYDTFGKVRDLVISGDIERLDATLKETKFYSSPSEESWGFHQWRTAFRSVLHWFKVHTWDKNLPDSQVKMVKYFYLFNKECKWICYEPVVAKFPIDNPVVRTYYIIPFEKEN